MHRNKIAVVGVMAIAALLVLPMSAFALSLPAPEGNATARDENLSKTRLLLDQEVVRDALESRGISEDRIEETLEKMSDEELSELASQADRIEHGASAGVAVAIVAVVVLLTFLLLLFLGGLE